MKEKTHLEKLKEAFKGDSRAQHEFIDLTCEAILKDIEKYIWADVDNIEHVILLIKKGIK